MPAVPRVDGYNLFTKALGGQAQRAKREGTVSQYLVGYSALSPEGYNYAVRQHEDLTLNHPNGGQAKFLEQPARENSDKHRAIIAARLRAGGTMRQALLAAANALKADSQPLVPIDTGELVLSCYVRLFK